MNSNLLTESHCKSSLVGLEADNSHQTPLRQLPSAESSSAVILAYATNPQIQISPCNVNTFYDSGNCPEHQTETRTVSNSLSKDHDQEHNDGPENVDGEDLPTTSTRPSKVRFRSRVRITSGLNRRKRSSEIEPNYLTLRNSSSSSSLSGSPSSSISAPLRSFTQNEGGKPGWGTLGQRVSIFARANGYRKRERSKISISSNTQCCNNIVPSVGYQNERTPLINSVSANQYRTERNYDMTLSDEEIAQTIDLVFGSWPKRLLNPHWWWWHLEPIACCSCLAESDEEG